jgi:hypothetical protein
MQRDGACNQAEGLTGVVMDVDWIEGEWVFILLFSLTLDD